MIATASMIKGESDLRNVRSEAIRTPDDPDAALKDSARYALRSAFPSSAKFGAARRIKPGRARVEWTGDAGPFLLTLRMVRDAATICGTRPFALVVALLSAIKQGLMRHKATDLVERYWRLMDTKGKRCGVLDATENLIGRTRDYAAQRKHLQAMAETCIELDAVIAELQAGPTPVDPFDAEVGR